LSRKVLIREPESRIARIPPSAGLDSGLPPDLIRGRNDDFLLLSRVLQEALLRKEILSLTTHSQGINNPKNLQLPNELRLLKERRKKV
jgi:hypothetical protein